MAALTENFRELKPGEFSVNKDLRWIAAVNPV